MQVSAKGGVMRKITLILSAIVILLPALSQAKPLDELMLDKGVLADDAGTSGQVSYKNGTRLMFGDDFNMKLNLQMKTRLEHIDIEEGDDTTGTSLNSMRLILGGDMMGGDWSYMMANDFVTDDENSSEFKDGWIQRNFSDAVKVRFGQYKTPFSRQFLAGDTKLQIMDRALVTDLFDLDRQAGLMAHGDIGDGLGYSAGLFNGETDGEGINSDPQDNDMQGIIQLFWASESYGDRNMEGDIMMSDDFGFTAGSAVGYGKGDDEVGGQFDKVDVNVDLGLRCGGFSAQGEFFFSEISYDDDLALGGEGDATDYGFYAQMGYFFTEDWEGTARFSLLTPDDDVSSLDDAQEYVVGLGHYINGHNLKILADVAWIDTSFVDGADFTDIAYQLELVGYL